MATSIVVDDVPYDFYSLQVSMLLGGGPRSTVGPGIIGVIKGIEDIEYSSKIQRTKLYGSSRVPRIRTDGDVEPEGSMTLWRSHFQAIAKFAKAANVPLGKLHTTIAITYVADGYPPYTDTLWDVMLAEIGNSAQRGPDAVMVKVPLDMLNIFYDGVDVFGNRL